VTATRSHSSAVMKGAIGWSRRSTVSSVRSRVRRVARCSDSLPSEAAPWRSRGTVAVLVPDEGVDRVGDGVEPVLAKPSSTVFSRPRCSSPAIQRSACENVR
jgi:hypothetical protein